MVRIFSGAGLLLTLFAFVLPASVDTSEAGSRYKQGKNKSWSSSNRSKRIRGAIYLSIPDWWYDDNERRMVKQRKYYRGGPKIINVEEELRRRRERNKREMIN